MKLYKWLFIILFAAAAADSYSQPAAFSTGRIGIDVNDIGRIRLFNGSPAGERNIYRLSLLVGSAPGQVFDYMNDAGAADSLYMVTDSTDGVLKYTIHGAVNNSYSDSLPAVTARYTVYGWSGDASCIIKFHITNNQAEPINAVTGLDIVAQTDGRYGFDTVKAEGSTVVINKNRFIGVRGLNKQFTSLKSTDYSDGYWNDISYYQWLTFGTMELMYISGPAGAVSVPAHPAETIFPGDSSVFYYAVALADSQHLILDELSRAEQRYFILTGTEEEAGTVPVEYALEQNYPNPFNPATKIKFSIKEEGYAVLKVYDVLGKEVMNLFEGYKAPGSYTAEFKGGGLASGVYIYTLKINNTFLSRKMLYLK